VFGRPNALKGEDTDLNGGRGILAMVLPLSAVLGAVPAIALFLAGVPTSVIDRWAAVLLLLGIVSGAALAPRLLPGAVQYSLTRRALAGIFGLVSAIAVGRGLAAMGIVPDALSHLQEQPSSFEGFSAIAQEAASILAFYGTLGVVAFVVLGPPPARSREAAEQADAADGASRRRPA